MPGRKRAVTAEARLKRLGIRLPSFAPSSYYGIGSGRMKPYHVLGKVLYLSGHTPWIGGKVRYGGRLGDTLTLEEGYEAARLTGLNVLAGVRQAVGDLDGVKGLIRTLNFVVCTPTYYDVHKVSSGLTDLLYAVYGPKVGVGCRATIGVAALAHGHCFETWAEFEIA